MSEPIHHECGVAYIRLLQPLSYFSIVYGTPLYPFQKLSLLMQKQRNRGHDGVGIGCVKIGMEHGKRYLFRERSMHRDGLTQVFEKMSRDYNQMVLDGRIDPSRPETVKEHFDFGGENLVGHLRYTTFGGVGLGYCHPQIRESTWATKSLLLLGNFNMTNTDELLGRMVNRGQHPFLDTDTQVILEDLGFHLDEAHTDIYRTYRHKMPGRDIPPIISEKLDIVSIVRECAQHWDGGYSLVGLVGNGDGFVMRDPQGIRPCFYFADDEMIVFASERPPLMTVFDKTEEQINELPPGHVASIKNTNEFTIQSFAPPRPARPCSFERIYFSRGNDPDIYEERKALGAALVPQVIEVIEDDLENTVFSFIPNTAEIGYLGLMDGLRRYRRDQVSWELKNALDRGELTHDMIDRCVLGGWPRSEKVANKDEKFRTFISKEEGRNTLVSFAYDITYGLVHPTDNLVVLDDSIVRGTTLREAIIKILTKPNPKRLVIVSTAPQIRYPDCYGIDMSELGKFLAFQAAVELLNKRGLSRIETDVYRACLEELKKPVHEMRNCVKAIYEPFTAEEISAEMALKVKPDDIPWRGEFKLIFQKIENLHASIPVHQGDWYFTGDYPTPGGYQIVNRAFVHYYEAQAGRSYSLHLAPTA